MKSGKITARDDGSGLAADGVIHDLDQGAFVDRIGQVGDLFQCQVAESFGLRLGLVESAPFAKKGDDFADPIIRFPCQYPGNIAAIGLLGIAQGMDQRQRDLAGL